MDDTPNPQPEPINVDEVLTELLNVDTEIERFQTRRAALRDRLDQEARRRWKQDRAVPSWKVPRLGSATLAGVDSQAPSIVDEFAYSRWALSHHSVACQLVIDVTPPFDGASPAEIIEASLQEALNVGRSELNVLFNWNHVVVKVHPSVLTGLLASGRVTDEGQVISEDGEIVPGVHVAKKDPYLSVRLHREAKARARARAEADESRAQAMREQLRDEDALAEIHEARQAIGAPWAPEDVPRTTVPVIDYVDEDEPF